MFSISSIDDAGVSAQAPVLKPVNAGECFPSSWIPPIYILTPEALSNKFGRHPLYFDICMHYQFWEVWIGVHPFTYCETCMHYRSRVPTSLHWVTHVHVDTWIHYPTNLEGSWGLSIYIHFDIYMRYQQEGSDKFELGPMILLFDIWMNYQQQGFGKKVDIGPIIYILNVRSLPTARFRQFGKVNIYESSITQSPVRSLAATRKGPNLAIRVLRAPEFAKAKQHLFGGALEKQMQSWIIMVQTCGF